MSTLSEKSQTQVQFKFAYSNSPPEIYTKLKMSLSFVQLLLLFNFTFEYFNEEIFFFSIKQLNFLINSVRYWVIQHQWMYTVMAKVTECSVSSNVCFSVTKIVYSLVPVTRNIISCLTQHEDLMTGQVSGRSSLYLLFFSHGFLWFLL